VSLQHLRLPDTQITQNLLSSTQDRIKLLSSLELLYKFTHSRFGQRPSTKDLNSFIGYLSGETRRLHLEESNLTGKVTGLFFVGLYVKNS
jgi:hypothetical protein